MLTVEIRATLGVVSWLFALGAAMLGIDDPVLQLGLDSPNDPTR